MWKMLELSHNGVVILDAVIDWYRGQDNPQPFEVWWEGLSNPDKYDTVLHVLDQHLRRSLSSKKRR